VTLPVAKEKEEKFQLHLAALIVKTKAVAGLERFASYRRVGAPGESPEYLLYEVWSTRSGLRKQWKSHICANSMGC
jgi:quinol monooxygenase YgiN